MKKVECRHTESCSAPLCPLLAEKTLKETIWYPNEEVCKRDQFCTLTYVKTQKAVRKKATNMDAYFSLKMLDYEYRVRKGISGINPELSFKEAEKCEKEWIKKHPEITEELKKRLRENLKRNLGQKPTPDFNDEDPM